MSKTLKELNAEWGTWSRSHRKEHNALADKIIHWKEDEDYSDYAVRKREMKARSDMVVQFCQETMGWTKEEATNFAEQKL